MKIGICMYVSLCCLGLAPAVYAEGSAADKAAAEALFNEGVALVAAGSFEMGCSKFEGSQALDPTLGTTLRLGDCYEHLGRTASAWAMFKQAEGLAHRHGEAERESLAHERAEALSPTLSYLTINLALTPPAGLIVERNGESQPLATLGVAIPVDPGPQELSAHAPGFEVWSKHIEIKPGPRFSSVTIPELQRAAVVNAPPRESVASKRAARSGESAQTQRVVGVVATVTGTAAVLAGAGFGWYANHENDRSRLDQYCPNNDHNGCNSAGVTIRQRAQAFAQASTIAIVGGAAVLGAGIVLWSTAPTHAPQEAQVPRLRLMAQAAPGALATTLGGTW
jgi:hypothetical protein